jgi:glycolate oxidase FAD binding subunit
VAGYDLMKLLIGSYGTLAVITSASFKLFPAPRQIRTFLAEFATAKEALEFRDRVMRSPLSPMCLDLVSPGARKMMRPEMAVDSWVMCVRAAGSDPVLSRYRKELGSAVTRELEGDGEIKMWRAIESFAMVSASPRLHINMPSRDVLSAVETLNSVAGLAGIDLGIIGRVGVGHLLVAVPGATGGVPTEMDALVNALRTRFTDINIKVDGALNPWPITPSNLSSMRAIKRALDPNNILRGRQIS